MRYVTGIYKITNTVTGRVYIGKSVNIASRIGEHKRDLRQNRHCNPRLQNSWNKHGEDVFKYEVLDTCTKEELQEKEIYYIQLYNACNHKYGYNIREEDKQTRKLSESHKQHLSEVLKSKYIPKPAYVLYFKTGVLEYYEDMRGISKDIIGKRGRNYVLGTVKLSHNFTLEDFKSAYIAYNKYVATNTGSVQLILRSDTEQHIFTSFSQVSKFLYGTDSATKVLQQHIDNNITRKLKGTYTLSGI